jgi:hypothetical protein
MENDRTKTYSIGEFCETAKALLENDVPAFVRFMLCGHHPDHQVVVDPIQDRLDDDHRLKALRDFDSLLGIDKDIRVHSSLTLFPLARKEDTLRTNLHLKHSFQIADVSSLGLKSDTFLGLNIFLEPQHRSHPYHPKPLHCKVGCA